MKISISIASRLFLMGARAPVLVLLLWSVAGLTLGQSIDISYPSPVRTNEVAGAIAARDLGDSRLTDHFYAFTGAPGDVLVTVKSNNLNGDVDLFTAGSLRPLMKFTLYAENSSASTRSVFLRKREDLILRVQARSPNDDEGTYVIRLGGSFQPIAGDPALAESQSPTSETPSAIAPRSKGSRRVSSVGARIAEPPAAREEVVTVPTPQPTPEDLAAPTTNSESSNKAETPAPAPTPGRARGRVPPGRRKPTSQPARKTEQPVAETTNEPEASEATTNASGPPRPTRRTGRRGTLNRPAEQIPVPEPQTGPRLVIQMQDGTLIERFMSTVRRVTVENNQIVVVRKDGVIERTRMSEVVRMAIEP